jgi:hypothetical protein
MAELELEIPNHPPIHWIRELRGSLSLLTGGDSRRVIVPNAFKHLTRVIKTADLDASGIAWVRLTRPPRSQWPHDPMIQDCFAVKVASYANAVVGCEILDPKGRPISKTMRLLDGKSAPAGAGAVWTKLFDAVFGTDASEPDYKQHVTMELDTGVRVPEGASLRLTVRRDTIVRVPFAVKDIPVPEIGIEIDLPASREGAFVEAMPVACGDPILADLKFHAKAGWDFGVGSLCSGKPDEPVRCTKAYEQTGVHVDLALQGNPAELTTGYGEVDVTSACDQDGNPLDLLPQGNWEMKRRLNDEQNPKVTFAFTPLRPVRKIRELRGTMSLETSDQSDVVMVRGLLNKIKPKTPIDDKALKAIGIKVTVSRSQEPAMRVGGMPLGKESLGINVEWQRNAVVKCELCDGKGRALDKDSGSFAWTGARSAWFLQSFSSIPPDVQLRLVVQKNGRKVRVPFALKDIDVPRFPVEDF